jgi:hypothetical protein
LTRAQVESTVIRVFGERPSPITLQSGKAGVAFALGATPTRPFELGVFLFGDPKLESITWQQREAYRRSGYAVAKVSNVLVMVSRPGARLGINGPAFAMPKEARALILRLRILASKT